jgi:hypothetical protein
MKLGQFLAVVDRVIRRMDEKLEERRDLVSGLPRSVQAIITAGFGPRATINRAELTLLLRGARDAIESSAGGLFRKALPEDEVDLSVATRAKKRHPAALALYDLVLDREQRRRRLGPAVAAQMQRVNGFATTPVTQETREEDARRELMRLFALPLDACLREAAAAFARAHAMTPARELSDLGALLREEPDAVVTIARRARDVMSTHASALVPQTTPTHSHEAAAAHLLELQRAASTLPD